MHNQDNYVRYLEVAVLTLLRDRLRLGGCEFDSVRAVKNDFPPTAGGTFTPYNIRRHVETEIEARRKGRRSFGPRIPA